VDIKKRWWLLYEKKKSKKSKKSKEDEPSTGKGAAKTLDRQEKKPGANQLRTFPASLTAFINPSSSPAEERTQ
jgi:hypothetical protein